MRADQPHRPRRILAGIGQVEIAGRVDTFAETDRGTLTAQDRMPDLFALAIGRTGHSRHVLGLPVELVEQAGGVSDVDLREAHAVLADAACSTAGGGQTAGLTR